MKEKHIIGFVLGSCVIWILSCSDKNIAGNGTRTGNPTIAGVLYNADGSRAVHAKVKFVPVDFDPRAGSGKSFVPTDSTTTNDTGHYGADSLPTNTYNLFFSGNGNLAYRDSITIRPDSHTVVPSDTLKAPGSLHGRVRLQPGDDARNVFILFTGSMMLGAPGDSTGKFDVSNMAEGDYRVRFLTTLDNYTPKDTTLRVTAGKTDTLPHDIILHYTGIPVPEGLRFTYDTLRQIVSLFWNKPTAGRPVISYKVYRRLQNAPSFSSLQDGVPDTTFSDSAVLQDAVYEYRVAALDSNESEGVKSPGMLVYTGSAFRAAFLSPVANSVWTPTTAGLIAWKSDSALLGGRVDLYLYKASERVLVIADSAPDTGAYLFTAPFILASGNDYRIGIANHSATAVAGFSAMFGIQGLASDAFEPDGESASASLLDSLGRVQTHTLTYHDTDWIKFRADSGRTYRLKISGDVSSGAELIYPGDPEGYSYFRNTTVPSTLEWTCIKSGLWYVRITPFSPNTGGTYSFSIARVDSASTVSVTYPTSGIYWIADSSYLITWTPDSSLTGSRVMLYLYKGSQAVYAMHVNIPNKGAVYHHLASDLISGADYRIKVIVYSNQDVMEGFSAPFTVYGIAVDAFEPDDKRESASAVKPVLRFSQEHTLTPHDTDWISFEADSGVFYGLHASGMVPTKMCLFYGSDTSAYRCLRSPSLSPWVCPRSGRWYAQITLGDSGQFYDNSRYYSFMVSHLDSLENVKFLRPPTAAAATVGSTLMIQWLSDSANLGDTVTLSLYKGDQKIPVFSDGQGSVHVPNGGYFDWPVPQGLATGSDYRVALDRVSAPSRDGFFDFSLPFTIMGTAGIQSLRR